MSRWGVITARVIAHLGQVMGDKDKAAEALEEIRDMLRAMKEQA